MPVFWVYKNNSPSVIASRLSVTASRIRNPDHRSSSTIAFIRARLSWPWALRVG